MGTGWRRALCTSVQRDDHDADAKPKKRRPHDAGAFFSSYSKGSTPALQCRTKPLQEPAPVTPPSAPAPMRKPRVPLLSAPSSPRSPSRFALLKASLLPSSKSRCGVCSRSVKRSSGSSAVFTAECSHAFHFPCIASHAHARSSSALSCPVCAAPWRQAPFLASLRLHCSAFSGDMQRKTCSSSGGGKFKVYDDDETLVAPNNKAAAVGNGGFNPIPEADEEEEAGEFGGSFPARPSSGVAVTVAPEAALVSSGRRHGRYVVAVKVRAPSPWASPRRAPIDLITVLDVSQRMVGEKLQALKRGMRLLVASLGPADRLSVVAFSGAATKRLLPLRRMTRQGQRSARQIVDRLVVCAASSQEQSQQSSSASACVGDALRKATKALEDRRYRNPVATVMLLSDTQQQQQDTHHASTKQQQFRRPSVVAPPATRFTHVEIPIDAPAPPPLLVNPNEEEVRKQEEEPPVEHAFAKCLGGLVSVVMQEVHLELLFPTGEITAVYSSGPGQQAVSLAHCRESGAVSVRLGEMYAEEERELLVELRAPLVSGGDNQHQPLSLSVRCSYRDPASQDTVRGADQPLPLPPLLQSSSSWRLHDLFVATRAVAESRRLAELHDLFAATRAVAESRRLAELHDLATAIHLLSSARVLLMQSPPSQQRQELVASLDTELSDMRWRRTQHQPLTPTSSTSRRRRDASSESTTPRGGSEPLTPTSAWRAAEQLAKVAIMRKSMNRVSDLHGFENARF